MADGGEVAPTRGGSRIAARERGFRLLAVTVTALFLAFAALGGAFVWYDRAAGWLIHTHGGPGSGRWPAPEPHRG